MKTRRGDQLRQRIAYETARILADGSCRDIRTARRKTAERLGATRRFELPTEAEIEQALMVQQALFRDQQPTILHGLRQQAAAAMKTLAPFTPRLVGPVLTGTAGSCSRVELHLFCETPEEVILFLLDRGIPWRDGERTLHFSGGIRRSYPLCRFHAGDTDIELILLPPEALHQPPLGPLGDRPLQRASLKQLQELIAQTG